MLIQFEKVKLKAEWLGHQKGAVLEINKIIADKLFKRGAAVPFKEKKKKGAETKDVESPNVDKMMRTVKRKKRE